MTAKDLKNALLQEAVQGKLVPQIASEGNARDLLEEIRKARLSHGLDFANAKSGKKSKKETALAGSNPCDIPEDEIPFDIPESWCWCRLEDIVELKSGNQYEESDSGTLYLKVADMNLPENAYEIVTSSRFTNCSDDSFIPKNSIIFPKRGGAISTNKKKLILKEKVFIDSNTMGMIPKKNELLPYLYSWFDFIDLGKLSTGTSVPQINNKDLYPLYFPLPPLAEQKRIVAAIEKFMPLIEEYGKKETVLNELNAQIGTLTKKAILQEAVQGKLVPQIPSEGNAKDLLEQIRKSHTDLQIPTESAGKKKGDLRSKSQIRVTKKEKNLPEITDDEVPFDIPESWCWVRWGELSDSIQYGYNASAQEKGKIKMVRISDIQENKVLWDTVPFCEIKDEEISTYLLKENDILFARTGGTVGKSFLVKNIPCDAIYAGYLIRTHYNSEKLVPEYLKYFMESELYWSQLKNGTIATAQPNCNGQTLSKMIIPLPPLSEQKRIVAAIEQLLLLCEKLGK